MKMFGKPVTITRAVALRHLALATLRREDLRFGKQPLEVWLSDMVVHRGALFDSSGARVVFPEGDSYDRCRVALFDPTPNARWEHRAAWGFVPASREGRVVIQYTDYPEHCNGPTRLLQVSPEDWGRARREALAMQVSPFLEDIYRTLQSAVSRLDQIADPRREDLNDVLDHLFYALTDDERDRLEGAGQ